MQSKADVLLATRARRHGIAIPIRALAAARAAHLEYAILCAVLMRETSGGHNVFGHDPTICVGWGAVTENKYRRYLALRRRTGKMQGVGPTQLTWYGFQDEADHAGGCWRVYPNVLTGARVLRNLIREHGLTRGLAAWNGSAAYGRAVTASVSSWRYYLSGAHPTLIHDEILRPDTLDASGGVKHVGYDRWDHSILRGLDGPDTTDAA